ncbi:MAG: putative branched-chain amino acid transport system substrate-binding protein precursor [Acidimicrobiales bacterium]|nr:putative branched-chain amino acid transport system substrate-binding protein precursor [Acidimicrobiales bacterium]
MSDMADNVEQASRRRRRGRGTILLSVGLTASMFVAACGSSSKSSTTTAPPTSTGPAVSGTPIKIGQIAAGDVTYQPKSSTAKDVLDMWVKWTNNHGGVAGHPVEVVSRDEKGDPAVGLSAAKELLQQEKVVALVGNNATSAEQAIQPVIEAAKVPVVGGVAYGAAYLTSKAFYPVGPQITTQIFGALYAVKNKVNVSAAAVLICNESAICDGAIPLYQKFAPTLGMTIGPIVKAAVTQPNYTAECLSIKDKGVKAIIVAGPPLEKVASDCKRQGFEPRILTNDLFGVTPAVAKNVNLVSIISGFPVFQQFPETKAFFDALKQYHPEYLEGGDKYDSFVSGGTGGSIGSLTWAAAEAFKKAVENSGAAPTATVTSADVIKGLSMFKGETLGGIAQPLTYGDGTTPQPQQKCFFLASTETGKITAPDGLKPSCMP